MEVLSMPTNMALILIIITLLKIVFKNNERFLDFIPVISALLGGILGVVQYFAVPVIAPSDNIFHTIIFGIFSGLSTTGSEDLVLHLKDLVQKNKLEKKEVLPVDVKNNEITDDKIQKIENNKEDENVVKEIINEINNITLTGGDNDKTSINKD